MEVSSKSNIASTINMLLTCRDVFLCIQKLDALMATSPKWPNMGNEKRVLFF